MFNPFPPSPEGQRRSTPGCLALGVSVRLLGFTLRARTWVEWMLTDSRFDFFAHPLLKKRLLRLRDRKY